MAIEGPLRELALSDVLQLLDLSRKTGVLSVQRDGADVPVRLYLEGGAITGVQSQGHTRRIGELLLLAGRVTEAQIATALRLQRGQPQRALGALLVELSATSETEVQRQLRFQVEELVFDLVRADDGYFRFQEAPPRRMELPIRVPTEPLLMEAARRTDEWSELGSGWSEAEVVPSLVEGPAGGRLQLQPFEWEVLAAIDGERSLRGIAREVGRGEFEVAKAVFGLVQAGVVAVGRRAHHAAPAGPAGAAAPDPLAEAQAALAQGRVDVAERVLEGAGDHHSGEGWLLRGRVAAAQGRWGEAVVAFGSAVKADPLLADAYRRLGMASCRVGELQEAEAALRTYLRLADPTTAGAARARAERVLTAAASLRQLLDDEEHP